MVNTFIQIHPQFLHYSAIQLNTIISSPIELCQIQYAQYILINILIKAEKPAMVA